MNTESGGSVWNSSEGCISALNNALFSDSLFRVETEKNLEQELSKNKSTKALMESNPIKEIKKASLELVNPALMQLKDRFGNCTFDKRKVKTYTPITNEKMLQ